MWCGVRGRAGREVACRPLADPLSNQLDDKCLYGEMLGGWLQQFYSRLSWSFSVGGEES